MAGAQQNQASAAAGGGSLKASTFTFSAGSGNPGLQSQQNPSGSTGLNLPGGIGSQSTGSLSLFNSGNPQQQNQPNSGISIFTAGGGGSSNAQQPNQSNNSSGLFNTQPPAPAPAPNAAGGFSGFKFSAGTNNPPQAQGGTQLSLFGNSSNPLSGSNTGGLNFTSGQAGGGGGGGGRGAASGFIFNGGQANGSQNKSGFNLSAGAANTGGGGLFQKAGDNAGQMGNPLVAGSQTENKFNFSAGLGNQQQQQQQGQGGTFPFGQQLNSISTSGFNFSTAGNVGLGLGNQTQNGSSGFNFSAGMGMNPGNTMSGPFNNSSSNVFQTQIQRQSSNLFQTPQSQKQFGFTTPTNQPSTPGQGGITTFQANPSLNFAAGTPGDSSRPMARARRRKK